MKVLTTRVFNNGNSQAVRIPQAFQLDVQQVEISRADNGDLIIHPIKPNRGDRLLAALTQFDDDFIDVLAQDVLTPQTLQDRDAL
jgi:antitoxin VapB